ncbi:MAG TPA: prephenate dehydratase domain-containing protein [Terriglobales bacterium]|nr:prephenate dehydratase domain-containing protein [Terriglobales bacterium]
MRAVPAADAGQRVAYQGEPGAFSEEAALGMLGPGIRLAPHADFAGVFRALRTGACDAIVVPVENSLAGRVEAVQWERARNPALRCDGELTLPIELHLLGLTADPQAFAAVRTVWSHPVALAQCRKFIARHGRMQFEAGHDTAGSVRLVMAAGDPRRAAIAGRRAALRYGAAILCEHIEDRADNRTRFLLLRR